MKKLSIIVPVYNVAPYLRKCVFSLIQQDFSDYEIVLIDDGSTDGSGKICDELSETINDERLEIRVIHQKNRGLSAARNAGIMVARGKYIIFVDSDDYWEENVLGRLMAQVERENLDVLRFNYRNVNETYEEFHPNKDPKRDVDFSAEVTDGETFLNERLGPACYAVMFILRRDLIISTPHTIHHTPENGDCLFTPGIYFEDVDWTPRMLLRAKRVASTPQVVYNYLWRTGSITLPTDPVKRKKVLEDKIRLIGGFIEQQQHVRDNRWFTWQIAGTTISILGILSSYSTSERKLYISKLKAMDIFPLSMKREKMLSHKIKIMLANISPSLYCNLMSLRK